MLNVPHIAGVRVTPLRVIGDDRGAVLHLLRADAADFTSFGECYFSEINAGALKAWKRHRLQAQNLAVPAGRVRVVVLDERPASPTCGRIDCFELGRPDAYLRLHIDAGLWYGFHGLADRPSLIANCADRPHDPADNELADVGLPAYAAALLQLRQGCSA